jgi:hypothetical protein
LHVEFDVDTRGEPPLESIEFLAGLVAEPGPLALILSGFSKDWLLRRQVVVEYLSDLSAQDIEDGIARIFRELNRPAEDTERLSAHFSHRRSRPQFLARVAGP